MSFVQRLITTSVQLAPNTGTNQPNKFQESGTDTLTLSNLRTSVRVENSGAPADGRAQVKVWGMTPSQMAQLATLGMVFNLVPKNKLTATAGDAKAGMSAVFSGTIQSAYADYSSQPDVPFIFECLIGLADAVVSLPPSSFPGPTSVATIMSGLARQMNIGFQNFGVSITARNEYLKGSAKQQADTLARRYRFTWGYVNPATMGIWPLGQGANAGGVAQVPVISPQTGMASYPAFTQQGIVVKTLFNPAISFNGLVQVKSSVLDTISQAQVQKNAALAGAAQPQPTVIPANTFPTQWAVNKLDLALDALVPKGQWLSTVYGYNPGYAKAILPPA